MVSVILFQKVDQRWRESEAGSDDDVSESDGIDDDFTRLMNAAEDTSDIDRNGEERNETQREDIDYKRKTEELEVKVAKSEKEVRANRVKLHAYEFKVKLSLCMIRRTFSQYLEHQNNTSGEVGNLRNQIEALTISGTVSRNEKEELLDKIDQLKKQVDDMARENEDLKTKLLKIEEEKSQQEEQLDKMDRLKEQMEDLAAENEALKTKPLKFEEEKSQQANSHQCSNLDFLNQPMSSVESNSNVNWGR